MSNKTRLQTNNNNLQSILNTVNSLPSGGSSGGSVETCTVSIDFSGLFSGQVLSITYTRENSGIIEPIMTFEIETVMLLERVVRGTIICFETTGNVEFSGNIFAGFGTDGTATSIALDRFSERVSLTAMDVI
jgi:hypothetical protein